MRALNQKTLIEKQLAATVRAGLYRNEEEALQEAISTWLAIKPQIRLEAAIELFRADEVTLDRAAEIAGINRWLFQDVLAQRGVKIVIEANSKEELAAAAKEIREQAN